MNNFISKKITDNFESIIKFYFSLLFSTKENYEEIKKGNDKFIKQISYYYEKINLKDEVILRIFREEDILNYYVSYTLLKPDFDINDNTSLSLFYNYMLESFLEDKKQKEKENTYEYFSTCYKEEVDNAINNLSLVDKANLINYFGNDYKDKTSINTNDKLKNELFIKLYTYILNKRNEADIFAILNNIKDNINNLDFFDHIRRVYGDNTLSNEFILKMVEKLDVKSKETLKEIHGKNLDKKTSKVDNKKTKGVIDNLVKIIKIEKNKNKDKKESVKLKKKVADEIKKEAPKKEKAKKIEIKEKVEKPKQIKVEIKKVSKLRKAPVKKVLKNKKEEPKKQAKKVIDDKNSRLSSFLKNNNIEKKDFELALKLLNETGLILATMYFGLKEKAKDIKDIATKLNIDEKRVWKLIDELEEKIYYLIINGDIEKLKKDELKKEAKSLAGNLNEFLTKNELSLETFSKVIVVLSPMQKQVVDMYLGLKGNANTIEEIAVKLKSNKEDIENVITESTNIIIEEVKREKSKNINIKEEKESKEEVKKTEKKLEEKKEEKDKLIKEKDKNLLYKFLKENNITRKEFEMELRKLDPFSKTILSLYFGLYGTLLTTKEISKMLNKKEEMISNVILSSRQKILTSLKKQNTKHVKISLKDYLIKNNLSKETFKEGFKDLSSKNKELIKLYFKGNYTIEEIAKKIEKKPEEVNNIINNIFVTMKKTNKNPSKNDNGRLNNLLIINKISANDFNKYLHLLDKFSLNIAYLYYGLGIKEYSIEEISKMLNKKESDIRLVINNIEKELSNLSKKDNLKEELENRKYENLISKISNMIKTNPTILDMLQITNPIAAMAITLIALNNININEVANMLSVKKENIYDLLNQVSLMDFNLTKKDLNNNSNFNNTDELEEKSIRSK